MDEGVNYSDSADVLYVIVKSFWETWGRKLKL